MNAYQFPAEIVTDLARRYTNGERLTDLAAELDVDVSVVHRILKQIGIKIRKRGKLDIPSFAQDAINMANDGVRVYEIARMIGVTQAAVNSFLASRGIEPKRGPDLLPPSTHWFCRDCKEVKLAFEFFRGELGRPYSPCVACSKKRADARHQANPEKRKNWQEKKRIRLKQEIISAYGGTCSCCGESQLIFLTLDHSFDDGEDHRRRTGGDIYGDLRRRGYPQNEGIRVQCYNCNYGRRPFTCCPHAAENGCPNFKQENWTDNNTRERRQKLRFEMIEAYGGACACCGESNHRFLCADHVRGDGARARRKGERTGATLWLKIKREGFPKDRFQVLCFNCNIAKRQKQRCPHQQKAS